MRKFVVVVATAAAVAGFSGSASAAEDTALGRCNGVVDFACYTSYSGDWCTLWINGSCWIG